MLGSIGAHYYRTRNAAAEWFRQHAKELAHRFGITGQNDSGRRIQIPNVLEYLHNTFQVRENMFVGFSLAARLRIQVIRTRSLQVPNRSQGVDLALFFNRTQVGR